MEVLLDHLLLGLVGGLGALRRPVHRPHLARPHPARIRLRRDVHPARLHLCLVLHLRQQRHRPGRHRRRTGQGRPGNPGHGPLPIFTVDTLVAQVDLAYLTEQGKDTAMIVVVTNMEKVADLSLVKEGTVAAKEVVGTVTAQ